MQIAPEREVFVLQESNYISPELVCHRGRTTRTTAVPDWQVSRRKVVGDLFRV